MLTVSYIAGYFLFYFHVPCQHYSGGKKKVYIASGVLYGPHFCTQASNLAQWYMKNEIKNLASERRQKIALGGHTGAQIPNPPKWGKKLMLWCVHAWYHWKENKKTSKVLFKSSKYLYPKESYAKTINGPRINSDVTSLFNDVKKQEQALMTASTFYVITFLWMQIFWWFKKHFACLFILFPMIPNMKTSQH